MTVGQALERMASLLPGEGRPIGGQTPLTTALAPLLQRDAEAQAEGVALAAAEPVGELVRTLRQLSDDLDATAAAWRTALAATAYPLFVLHLVAPAASMGQLIRQPARFIAVVAVATAAIWATIALALLGWRRLVATPRGARMLARLPLLGPPLVLAARARWLRLVATLHGAGTKAIEGFALAERALGAAPPSDEYAAVTAGARRGATLDEALRALTGLPPEELAPLLAAAAVGDFESAARRLAGTTTERWRAAAQRLARVIGGAIYASAFVIVVLTLLRFYADYYGALLGRR
ncbi:MAG: hypothetical protein FJ293_13445 [Planctomycetes bacterium]|nr:hypothetical protein [Planctomycetota bacterium]